MMIRFFYGKTCETEYLRADRLSYRVELSFIYFEEVSLFFCR